MSDYFDPYGAIVPDYSRQSFHAVYKEILVKLESVDDIEVLHAITTLSTQLSMAQEETLSHIPVDTLLRPLVRCLDKESIPEIGLHAIMSITHLIDILPPLVGAFIN